jgi:GT2 family glycosyltransferase
VTSAPRISVVVPTYRRPDLIERCLRALQSQDVSPSEFEIIVVDDEPAEATRQRVESLRMDCGARTTYIANRGVHGPAAARNLGWQTARAPLIAFTDDDCIPQATWLRAGLEAMGDGTDAAMGCLVVPVPDRPTDYERMTGRLAQAGFVTANCFCRRAALEAIGGFDERFRTAWREDSDLHFRLEAAGYRVIEARQAVVVHPVRSAAWGVSLREQRKSQYNALLFRKHRQRYREHIGPVPNWAYLAIDVTLLGFVLALVRDARRLSGLLGLAWLAQTVAFAIKRLRNTSHEPAHVLEMAVTSALIPPLSTFWRVRGAVRFRTPFL